MKAHSIPEATCDILKSFCYSERQGMESLHAALTRELSGEGASISLTGDCVPAPVGGGKTRCSAHGGAEGVLIHPLDMVEAPTFVHQSLLRHPHPWVSQVAPRGILGRKHTFRQIL